MISSCDAYHCQLILPLIQFPFEFLGLFHPLTLHPQNCPQKILKNWWEQEYRFIEFWLLHRKTFEKFKLICKTLYITTFLPAYSLFYNILIKWYLPPSVDSSSESVSLWVSQSFSGSQSGYFEAISNSWSLQTQIKQCHWRKISLMID